MILAIYCAGGMGREVLDLARSVNRWEQIVFVDDVTSQRVCNGAPVYRFSEIECFRDNIEFVIANGEPSARNLLYEKIKQANYGLTKIISSHCDISSSSNIGNGCILFQSRISPNVCIEDNVAIESGVDIGHDAVIRKYVVLNSMSFIGGYTHIGERTYIAPGALLKDRISVGRDVIVGLGAVVVRDVPDKSVVVGNPARKIRDNTERKVFGKHKLRGGVVLKLNGANFSCIGENGSIPHMGRRKLA